LDIALRNVAQRLAAEPELTKWKSDLERCFAVPPGLDHARSDGAVPR
jgi:hypothetical protein